MTMKLPQIEIDGKIYEMQEPRARMWRTWAEFDKNKGKLANADFIDETCKMIATVFDGVSAEELLENLALSDVMSLYRKCYRCLAEIMFSKWDELEKNSEESAELELETA